MQEMIKHLAELYGPAGREEKVAAYIQGVMTPLVDEDYTDTMGSVVAVKRGSDDGKKIMLAAHMYEIGVMITDIDENGFLRFSNIGGLSPFTLIGQRAEFADGTIGVFGFEKLDDIKDLKLNKMYIDIGAGSRGDAMAKVEGLSVARSAAYAVDPDYGIAVDVTTTGDSPEAQRMAVSLGKGAAVKVKDSSVISHPVVKDLLVNTAKTKGIAYQMEVLERGGTDAGSIHLTRSGVPTGAVSIPCRYVHTPGEMVDLGDVEACVDLLVAVLEGPWE